MLGSHVVSSPVASEPCIDNESDVSLTSMVVMENKFLFSRHTG